MNGAAHALLRYWPIVAFALAGLLGAYGVGIRAQVQIENLMEDREGDRRQWQVIADHTQQITRLQTELEGLRRQVDDLSDDVERLR